MQHQVEGALRLFLALPLPPELGTALGRWQREQTGSAGWSEPEGLHLTLAFLGERPAERQPPLERLAAAVAARHDAFTLRTEGLGGFPGGETTRLLWLGLLPCPALETLATDLRAALAAAGEAFDPKPFRAHVTLARFRRPHPMETFTAPAPVSFAVDRLVLFESLPQRCYRPLRAWPLCRR